MRPQRVTLRRLLAAAGLVLFYWSGGTPARAQQPLMGPSLSMEDPMAVFANPAILSFQRARLALGAKAYHLGVSEAGGVPLRQGAFVLSTPFLLSDRFGAGALVQYFDSPIFQRTSIGLGVSARVLRFVSVGVQLAAFNLSYDAANFIEFDPADPVFAGGYSRTVINASLGAYAQPLPALSLSLGVRNANSPDLSLVGDGVLLSPEPFIGAGYAVGPVRALLELVGTPYGAETRWSVEAVSLAGSYLRFSSNTAFDQARVEGLLHVGGPISVSYGYELPFGALGGATNGSHTVSVVYEFGRTPDLPDPIVPPAFLYTTELPALDPVLRPRVYTSATSDYLRYYEQIIVRQIDSDVPDEALRQLTEADLGALDSVLVARPPAYAPAPIYDPNERVVMTGSYSSQYEASLREAGRVVGRDETQTIRVTAPSGDVLRATGIRNRLVAQGIPENRIELSPAPADSMLEPATQESFLPEAYMLRLEPAETVLYFLGANQDSAAVDWEVRVEDADGRVVRSFSGAGAVPDQLMWDWMDETGAVIAPGVYQYRMSWTDRQGERHVSNRRTLYVQKFLRKTTVRVTRDPEALRREADRIELRIQH
ncbi:MAG: hypothetical protein SH809_21230 [Rhodothermales bacterium]|nr:hypothetical protein [Rhodothermales bacterium]